MPESQKTVFNIYCDESCHLEHDGQVAMFIGGIWCPNDKAKDISIDIRNIKNKFHANGEIKWTKVSPSRLEYFKELIKYFFYNKHLKFRCLIVDDKSKLNHSYFNQGSHDTFYYKMYFYMLEVILKKDYTYNVFIDIKDTRSINKVSKLGEILCYNAKDFDHALINTIGQIRSNESEILQLADLLIGSINYDYRVDRLSDSKTHIMNLVKNYTHHSFKKSTPPWEDKFNIFVFSPKVTR
jgi:hypothetical protein